MGILTGCTTLARNFDRLRAAMNKPEADEDTHNYGAFFLREEHRRDAWAGTAPSPK
jgi:hypothetical protein